MNDDRSKLVHQRTSAQEWVPTSKAGTVYRRRVFRYGGNESGRVSSVVRYQPGAKFPTHPHPQGEEIFVIEGSFSDWRGDHKAGTFLLNPEGFEHSTHSHDGCLIFVRLRQFPGLDRPQKAIDTHSMKWTDNNRKILMDDSFDDMQYLLRVENEKGVSGDVNKSEKAQRIVIPTNGLEVFAIQGKVNFIVVTETEGKGMEKEKEKDVKSNPNLYDFIMQAHDWIRIPEDTGAIAIELHNDDDSDAILLVKENTLRSAFAPV